jgi:cobalt-zinc-cadmium efflux system protein
MHHHSDHCHSHVPSSTGRLKFALILNLTFTIIEIVGGLWTGSVAILADAVHDLGDSVALGLALYLERKAMGKPSLRFTYGMKRLSLLSAFILGLILVLGSLGIIIECIQRLIEGAQVPHAQGMFYLALLGVAINGIAALRLKGGQTHNERILSWHMLEDMFGWLAVLAGAVVLHFWQLPWLDPALGLMVALYIGWNGGRNLLRTLAVFLQGRPPEVDAGSLRLKLKAVPGVRDIHDLHVWSLDGAHHVVSLHAVVETHDTSGVLKGKIRLITKEFGAVHTTIETETPLEDCVEDCEKQH